jgi:hypothetical protein
MFRSILTGAVAAFGLGACGEKDVDLWGSIDETFSLEFTDHEINKQGTALLIEYIKEDENGGVEKPCRLVVETANLLIVPNSDLDASAFEEGIVQIERVAIGGAEYPPITGGTLHFDDYQFVAGATISGNFTILFENGRNLFGNFNAIVEEIELDPVP